MENYSISDPIPENVEKELAEYPELLRQLLFSRGITTKKEAEKFLNPSYEEDLHDPFLMKDMERAVKRIFKAVEDKEKIVIYGDYDCDGIPGSVILHDFFKKIGYPILKDNSDVYQHTKRDVGEAGAEGTTSRYGVRVYIPDRHNEGYGLHKEAIEKFGRDDTKLLITVDLGITDIEEVVLANSLGIDVVVTDHHLPGSDLPQAFAILNPKQKGDSYPFDMLCGAGVTFKLVQALIKKIRISDTEIQAPHEGWEKWLLDMAGLATLSDMVPLRDENRALAYFGLKVLRKNKRLGLQQLFRKMNINPFYMTEEDLTFMLAPRLNAASRMDSPMRAFELLSTTDEPEAGSLARHLTEINNQRKTLVATVLRDVKRTLSKREKKDVIVIGNPKWRLGILGLIASRLVDEHQKPAFVWCKENGDIKGSCRSDGSVNVVTMMSEAKDGTLLEYGGHESAGGFSVSHEKIHLLEDELINAYRKTKRETRETNNELIIDRKLSLDDVTMKNYALIEQLSPFGIDNPKPTFLFEGLEIDSVKTFGKDKNHLELTFKCDPNPRIHPNAPNNKVVKAIRFFTNENSFDVLLEPGKKINLVANFEKSMFRNRPELRLRIVDVIA